MPAAPLSPERQALVAWAKWLEARKAQCVYSEGPDRMAWVRQPLMHLPWTGDCSSFVTWCYFMAGLNDPNGLHFDGEGYTGTLLHEQHLPMWVTNQQGVRYVDVLPGDLVVYGGGTGEHVALVIATGADPLTISMGEQGDPSEVYCLKSDKGWWDGREPQTFLRCSMSVRNGAKLTFPPGFAPVGPVTPPAPPKPVPAPTPTPPKPAPPAPPVSPVPAKMTPFPVPATKFNGQKPSAILKKGSIGWQVRWLQIALGLTATGVFGPSTSDMLGHFQRTNGLPVTGRTDAATWKALGA